MIVESYTPTAKGQVFHRSAAKYRLLLGAYGAGKSTMSVWEGILWAQEFPGSTGVIFRKTYPALRGSTIETFFSECPSELIAHYVRTEGRECVTFPNGSRILFRCLDDALKLGSMQFDWVIIDEAGEVGEREFRALAFGRLRGTVGPRRLVCASNPTDDLHWLYTFFVDQADSDKAVFHFSTYDNAAHLPDGYIARLEKMTPQEQRMYLWGRWGVMAPGAPVFSMFTEELHVGTFAPIPGRLICRGWDPGYSWPVCGWWQSNLEGQWVKLHELVGQNQDAVVFGQRVVDESRQRFEGFPFEDYCDIAGTQNHAGPTFVSTIRRKFGLAFHTRKLDLQKTLQAMRELFGTLGANGTPLARIDARCKRSVKAYSGAYYIDPNSREGLPKKPNHPYDDLVDADRYALAPALNPLSSPYAGRALPRVWRIAS